MSELKDRTYRLVGDSFQLSYVLKTGKNKRLIIFDDSDKSPAKHRNRAIRYCPNESSIFMEDQSDHAVTSPIIFLNKLLEVKATDLALQKFMSVHPSNVANGGSIFEELNPEVEAKEDLFREEMILDIKSEIRKKEKEKDGIYELQALAAVLEGSAQTVKNMSSSELKRVIYNVVDSNPERFINEKGNVVIFDDSEITRKYLVLKAITEGIVYVSPDKKAIHWTDNKNIILTVPRGVNPVEHFSKYLETDEGMLALEEIQNRSK